MNDPKDGHIKTNAKAPTPASEPLEGTKAVPMHHRLKLGKADGTHNPFGTGEVSKKSTVNNTSGKGW